MRSHFPTLLLLLSLGCGREYRDDTPTPPPPTPIPPAGTATPTGTITGRVTWVGAIPAIPLINGLVRGKDGSKWDNVPNHFAPKIDPTSKGIGGAVVWLAGVDPMKAKAWPFPPVSVEARDFRIRLKQGEKTNLVGFVRVGDEVALSSADAEYHLIRARGAAFFSQALPTAGAEARRKLDRAGHVEFVSGAGYFWSAADVFVCEHPYFAVTDSEGAFCFDGVPPGKYEAVAWLRNWQVKAADRDPETGRTMRLTFAAPFTTRAKVAAADGTIPAVGLDFSVDTGGK